MSELNTKNLRKAAFAIGFGLTLGKLTGNVVEYVLNGALQGIVKVMAGEGNKTAQSICEETGLKYKKNETHEEEPEKIKMGFHV